jgi:hypothetical protein
MEEGVQTTRRFAGGEKIDPLSQDPIALHGSFVPATCPCGQVLVSEEENP